MLLLRTRKAGRLPARPRLHDFAQQGSGSGSRSQRSQLDLELIQKNCAQYDRQLIRQHHFL